MPLESATLNIGIAPSNSDAISHRPSSSNSRSGAPLPCEALGQLGLHNPIRLGSFSKATAITFAKVDNLDDFPKFIDRLATSVAPATPWLPLRSHSGLGATNLFGWQNTLCPSERGHIKMDASRSKYSACSEQADSTALNADTHSGVSINSRLPFQFPEVGDEVIFTRSPSHERETGYVIWREYGTGCIEIVDINAKPLRLRSGQYRSAAR